MRAEVRCLLKHTRGGRGLPPIGLALKFCISPGFSRCTRYRAVDNRATELRQRDRDCVSKPSKLADDEPYRHDIFIALVAPIGSSRPEVLTALNDSLTRYGYSTDHIHLASLLGKVPNLAVGGLPERTEPDYYQRRMDAGNRLRNQAGDWSALAGVGVMRIAAARAARRPSSDDAPPPTPVAYIIDSLKNPREAELLRSVYGSALWIVAVVQDISERKSNLTEELARSENRFEGVPEAKAVELITRDQEEDEKHGQHVRDVFAVADYFLPVRRGVDWSRASTASSRGSSVPRS